MELSQEFIPSPICLHCPVILWSWTNLCWLLLQGSLSPVVTKIPGQSYSSAHVFGSTESRRWNCSAGDQPHEPPPSCTPQSSAGSNISLIHNKPVLTAWLCASLDCHHAIIAHNVPPSLLMDFNHTISPQAFPLETLKVRGSHTKLCERVTLTLLTRCITPSQAVFNITSFYLCVSSDN